MRSYLARIVSVVVLALFSAVAVQGGNPAVAAPEVSDTYEGSGTFTSVAYDPATGLLYAADLLGDTVSVFRNGVLTTKVVVGHSPAAMALDPLTHSVYVVSEAEDSVSIINGTTVTATIPVEHQPMDVAVDPGTGKVYVANGMTGLTVIEGDQVTGTIPIDGGYVWAVAVDTSTHTVYAANYSNSKVSVINDGVVTQTIPTMSGGPLSIAVDSVTHDVYVPGVFAGTISVINGDRVVRTIEFDLVHGVSALCGGGFRNPCTVRHSHRPQHGVGHPWQRHNTDSLCHGSGHTSGRSGNARGLRAFSGTGQ